MTERTLGLLNLRETFSKLSLRDERNRSQQPERRHRPMEIPTRSKWHDDSPVGKEPKQQALRNSSRHTRFLSMDSPPEQSRTECGMASIFIATRETGQHEESDDTLLAASNTNLRPFTPSLIPRMNMSQSKPTTFPNINPQWQPAYQTHISQLPLSSATTLTRFDTTPTPANNYGYYHAENAYTSTYAADAQLQTHHVPSTFDSTPRALAQSGHTFAPSPLSNNPYQQPPPYEATEQMNRDLEFALQISLANQEVKGREERRVFRMALEESKKDAYWS